MLARVEWSGVSYDITLGTQGVDRSSVYNIETVADQPIVLQPKELEDGTIAWVATPINPYTTIFGGTPAVDLNTTVDNDDVLTFAEAFTVAADDSRQVIDFLHTYPVPDTN